MTVTNLSNYNSIESGIFVKITCSYYKLNPGDTPTTQVLRFSDQVRTLVIDGDSYVGLGRLLSITDSFSEIKVSSNDLSINISGIPNSSISEIINSRIKGSTIKIYRAFYNSATGQLISSIPDNPMNRYNGIINNYSLSEEYNNESRSSSNTITLMCSSVISVLENGSTGRRTNPEDMKKFYPTDTSMDRVPRLINAYFDFGAPL